MAIHESHVVVVGVLLGPLVGATPLIQVVPGMLSCHPVIKSAVTTFIEVRALLYLLKCAPGGPAPRNQHVIGHVLLIGHIDEVAHVPPMERLRLHEVRLGRLLAAVLHLTLRLLERQVVRRPRRQLLASRFGLVLSGNVRTVTHFPSLLGWTMISHTSQSYLW